MLTLLSCRFWSCLCRTGRSWEKLFGLCLQRCKYRHGYLEIMLIEFRVSPCSGSVFCSCLGSRRMGADELNSTMKHVEYQPCSAAWLSNEKL